MGHERGKRGPKPRVVRVAQRHERAAAPFDEQRRLAVEQHHVRTGNPRGPRARTLRPRKNGAVRLGRVGGREHAGDGLLGTVAQLAQTLDRAAEGELRAAEAFDEVAPTAEPERLERTKLRVDRAVPSRECPQRAPRRG